MIHDLRTPGEHIIVCTADEAPELSSLLCVARPCGEASHGRFRVVVVDPTAPTDPATHVPAPGPETVDG